MFPASFHRTLWAPDLMELSLSVAICSFSWKPHWGWGHWCAKDFLYWELQLAALEERGFRIWFLLDDLSTRFNDVSLALYVICCVLFYSGWLYILSTHSLKSEYYGYRRSSSGRYRTTLLASLSNPWPLLGSFLIPGTPYCSCCLQLLLLVLLRPSCRAVLPWHSSPHVPYLQGACLCWYLIPTTPAGDRHALPSPSSPWLVHWWYL